MKNTLTHILYTVSIPILLVIGLSGCEEEVGCTDRNSDNYNPDAVRDDGSCTNSRDKFLGVYRAIHVCELDTFNGEFPIPNNYDTVQLVTIVEDELREQEDDVEIRMFGPDSVSVKALVSRHQLRIPTQTLDVRGIDMSFIGEGHIDDQGYLTILYTALPAYEDCVMFMYRIDD